MSSIKVMVNGLPGNVARLVAGYIIRDPRFELIPFSLTGPEIPEARFDAAAVSVELIRPDARSSKIIGILDDWEPFLSVDFSHPSAVNPNTEFYCRTGLPFVMGTTGGNRQQIEQTIKSSSIAAVVAPNMAKQIVGFQAMMEYAAKNFPGLFEGYTLEINESHQQGKADTSGTAKAMVAYFNQLGIPFGEEQITRVREPEIQRKRGIEDQYLGGHAWHTYTLLSGDRTVRFEFSHNVNGREIYGQGTLDALLFLAEKVKAGAAGQMFTMIDVLRGS